MEYIGKKINPVQASRLLEGFEELDEMRAEEMEKNDPSKKRHPKFEKETSAKETIAQLKKIPGTRIIKKKKKGK